jgi:hypothetical protein
MQHLKTRVLKKKFSLFSSAHGFHGLLNRTHFVNPDLISYTGDYGNYNTIFSNVNEERTFWRTFMTVAKLGFTTVCHSSPQNMNIRRVFLKNIVVGRKFFWRYAYFFKSGRTP